MNAGIASQIEALREMTAEELREKYAEVFGEPTTSRHKVYLQKRIIWGLQAREEVGLSERARRRAEELARESDLRLLASKRRTVTQSFRPSHDRRLPMPGTVLTREYRGRTVTVTVLEHGFDFEGTVYRSLSAVARAITGTRWNGYGFLGLLNKEDRP